MKSKDLPICSLNSSLMIHPWKHLACPPECSCPFSIGMPSPSVHLLNSDCSESAVLHHLLCGIFSDHLWQNHPKSLMYIIIVTLHKLFDTTCGTYFLVISELLKGKPRKSSRQTDPHPQKKEKEKNYQYQKIKRDITINPTSIKKITRKYCLYI